MPLRNAIWMTPLLAALAAPTPAAAKTLALYGGQFQALTRATRDQYDASLTVSGADLAQPDALDVLIAATGPKDHYRLRVGKWTLTLDAVQAGKARRLDSVSLPASKAASHSILVKRRSRFISVVWDGRLVLSALDASHAKGVVCLRTDKGARAARVHYQPVAPIFFEDSFMVTEDETKALGSWTAVSGDWSMHSVIEDVFRNPDARIRDGHTPEAERSVNPFSLSGLSPDGGIIVNGYRFWDDYDFGVSAKTLGGEMGLVFDYQNAQAYHLLRWRLDTEQIAAGRVQLLRVRGGKAAVLGTAYVEGRRNNWYYLRVKSVRGRIEAFIDGTRLFDVTDPHAAGGKIGLYARGARAAIYDDVAVEPVATIEFRTARSLAKAVREKHGAWAASERGGSAAITASGLTPKQAGLLLMGEPSWEAAQIRADVDTSRLGGNAGLVFGYQSPRDYWVALVDRKTQRAQAVRFVQGKAQAFTGGPVAGATAPYTIAVDTTMENALRVYVNDVLALRVANPGPIAGRVGLGAFGTGQAAFSRLMLFEARDTDWEKETSNDIFEGDPYMQGWASRRWAWKSGKPWGKQIFYEHKGDFFGAFRCRVPVSGSFTLRFAEDAFGKTEKGYAVDVEFDRTTKAFRITLRRAGRVVASAARTTLPMMPTAAPREITNGRVTVATQTPPKSFGPVVVHREGHYVWVEAGNKEILSYCDPAPLPGRNVAMIADKDIDLNFVNMKRDHVLDYLFERAPRDWVKVGEWKVTNRFACDPRWSFMNGRSRGLAALWNKYGLSGDFTIECYVGMRMRQGDLKKGGRTSYPRIGDINLAFCTDGRDLWTGYNFVLQGWDKLWSERWTRLYKLGRVVAKTDREFIPRTRDHRPSARVIPVEWDPGGRPIHGAWYFVKLRKRGGTIDMAFDDVPVLSYTDPKPLQGGQVALWTQDSSIVVARMKLSYSRRARGAARLAQGPAPAPAEAPADDPIRVVSLTHPSLVYNFETGLQGWREAHVDQGAVLTWQKRADGKGHCLKLSNAYPGGDAGAEIPVQRMDLAGTQALEFDYKLSPGALVNLYFQLEGDRERLYFVRLSGLGESSENVRRIAAVPDAKADGKWRHARIDIAGALRELEPSRREFVLQRMFVGNFHEGYLNAGLGGNKTGATYWIDNLSLISWGPSGGVFEWRPTAGRAFTHYAFCIDQTPNTTPPDTAPTTETLKVFDKLKPGLSYFHVRGRDAAGKWSRTVHYPVFVSAPLRITRITPPPGARWGGGPIRVEFARNVPAELELPETQLTLAGRAVPFDEYTYQYDPAKKVLTLRLNRTGQSFANGAQVDMALRYRSSLAVTPLDSLPRGASVAPVRLRAAAQQWHYVMDFASDNEPPSRVTTDKCLVDQDFESSSAWSVYGAGYADLVRDTSTAASGEASLKLVNQIVGGSFSALIHNGAFNAGRYPLVSFDYKTDGSARADLYLTGSMHTVVKFTDNDTGYTQIGVVPGMATDGKWRHAAFNLKHMLDTATENYTPKLYEVRRLLFADTGHCGNPPGVFFHLDNFRISSVLGGSSGIKMTLASRDLSGVAGYSYKWSAKPDDMPDKKVDSTSPAVTFANVPEGSQYLHLAAKDNAGNWGPADHYHFIVDNSPPRVVKTSPGPKALAAADEITVQLDDAGSGVDPSGFRMQLNGKSYKLTSTHTRYNPKQGVLSWNWVAAQSAMRAPIPDKSPMTVSLDMVKDFAGNSTPATSWTWRLDYAKDKQGPARPILSCYSRAPQVFYNFTSSIGYFRGSGRVSVERYFDPERRDWCLKAEKIGRGTFWVYAYRRNFYTTKDPILTFDYKFPKGLRLQMILYLNGQWRSVRMTAMGRYAPLGEFPGIVADGTWRHASINLHDLVAPYTPKGTPPRITYIAFAGGMPNQNPQGTTYYLDNFCITGPAPAAPRFLWQAKDATGIAGVSYVMDQKPWTVPDTTVDSKEAYPPLPIIGSPGLWYLHLRAQDGAGNWGAAEHHPYYVTEVPTAGSDGLEADPAWAPYGSSKTTRVIVAHPSTVSGKNKLLSISHESRAKRAPISIILTKRFDLRGKKKLVMDVCSTHASAATLYVQVRTGPRGEWYMTPSKTIAANGWTKGVTFYLAGKQFRTRHTRAKYTGELQNPEDTRDIVLRFYANQRRGTLLIDRMRFE